MPTYSIDTENNMAVHPDKDAAIKEASANGTAFAEEAELSEATALWPASRLVDVWNGFAGAPPFAELKEVKRFTDRKSAVARIWNAVQRLGKALEEETKPAAQAKTKAQQDAPSTPNAAPKQAKRIIDKTALGYGIEALNHAQRDDCPAAEPAKAAPTKPTQAPAKATALKDAPSADGAPAPKQREGTRKATVIALLEREGGATLEEIMAETLWQRHSVRGFISTLGSKHGYTIVSTRRESDKARVYAIEK